MTISQLISELQTILQVHGDLHVKCQDGLDPSDLGDVDRLRVSEDKDEDRFVEIASY